MTLTSIQTGTTLIPSAVLYSQNTHKQQQTLFLKAQERKIATYSSVLLKQSAAAIVVNYNRSPKNSVCLIQVWRQKPEKVWLALPATIRFMLIHACLEIMKLNTELNQSSRCLRVAGKAALQQQSWDNPCINLLSMRALINSIVLFTEAWAASIVQLEA